MLSILIPVYNYDCSRLAEDLNSEILENNLEVEIIVAEDGSDEKHKIMNRRISKLERCTYVEFLDNKGRARIRNLLGGMARGEWLVFIDCDAEVISRDFLRRYMDAAQANPTVDVFCGGLDVHVMTDPGQVSLRYAYSIKRERKSASARMKQPYKSFSSFNFMVRKQVFDNFPFDENFVEYGHEDTLFGEILGANGISLLHIDNPLIHLGLERNEIFLSKTRKSIVSLARFSVKLMGCSRLFSVYSVLHRYSLTGIVKFVYMIFRRKMESHLLKNSNPSMFVFDLYKLGYLSSLMGK